MRRILLIIIFIPPLLSAQVMNTARVLKENKKAIQSYLSFKEEDPYLYLAGEYGLKKATDLQINFGAGETTYFGANLEKVLSHGELVISGSGGVHYTNNPGLNFTGNLTLPLARILDIYTGLDMELNFSDEIDSPLWFFLGNSINYQRNLQFFLEVALGLETENIISLGINYNLGVL